jgi:hypothetical protein
MHRPAVICNSQGDISVMQNDVGRVSRISATDLQSINGRGARIDSRIRRSALRAPLHASDELNLEPPFKSAMNEHTAKTGGKWPDDRLV